MNIWSKRTMLAVLSSAVLLSGVSPAYAAETGAKVDAAAPAAIPAPASYKLNPSLQAEVKSIVAERTATGMRVGAVVRLTNITKNNARVPEYELHIRTSDGVVYELDPSTTNSRFVRPQSEAELSYMVDINGVTALDVTNLQWVDVNYYVYPRKQTVKLDVPTIGSVWQGVASGSAGAIPSGWGQPFELKTLKSPLVYTPVAMNEQATAAGMITVIKLLVKNTGTNKKAVPVLTVEGNDGSETFVGGRAETGELELLPNEDTFIHLVLPTKPDSVFQDVTIGTAESFTAMVNGVPQTTEYRVGRVKLAMPAAATPVFMVPSYKLGDTVDLSKISDMIPKNVGVALVEMSMHEPQGAGYKTIVTKFKVENNGTKGLPIPPLQAEIVSEGGNHYAGTRQSSTAAEVLPGLAAVVSYVFTVPSTETGMNVTLKLQEPVVSTAGTMVRSDLIGVKLSAEQPGTDKTFSFYPYTVTLNSKSFTTMFNVATGYSYKLKLDLDITKEEKVVTDRDFSLMEIEVVDSLGRTLGSSELSFVSNMPNGNRQLLSGDTVAYFSDLRTEQFESNLTIRIYEKIQTPTGSVKRLITSFK